MTDTAQLREALFDLENHWSRNDRNGKALLTVPKEWLVIALEAARERLAHLEAGALVIVPGEDGGPPPWFAEWWMGLSNTDTFEDAFDVLRDAIPGVKK